ncbi:MAG: hypothetical protein JSU86_09755 [Phycisphaerales bacterium]|nr:MAG: hypothetical protein JSU86_09755 [Phycisphaerales bacterium]
MVTADVRRCLADVDDNWELVVEIESEDDILQVLDVTKDDKECWVRLLARQLDLT